MVILTIAAKDQVFSFTAPGAFSRFDAGLFANIICLTYFIPKSLLKREGSFYFEKKNQTLRSVFFRK